MYKSLAITFLLQLCGNTGFSQLTRLPDLGIKSIVGARSMDVAPLGIRSNQTITGITSCPCLYACAVLPVKLLSFEGKRKNNQLVLLNWKTTNEFQNEGFEVQRSLGDVNHFEPVAFVPAQPGSGSVYKYDLPDPNTFSGTSYYRLRQIDFDGNFAYSDIVPVKGFDEVDALSIYPNPVAEKMTVDIFSAKKTTAVLLITDATQKLLYSQNIALNKGTNLINVTSLKLQPGVYLVRAITENGKLMVSKMVKL